MTNLDSILKSRDITLPTKVQLVKAMVFALVMYGCESWTIKKAECRRIEAFELWCWRRLFRVPWTARRSNQSILKEIRPGCSLEGLMLKLKFQYFGHLSDTESWLIWKDPDVGKDWGQEEKGTTEYEIVGWHHRHNGHGFGGLWELVMDREAWRAVVHGFSKNWTWLSFWTKLKWNNIYCFTITSTFYIVLCFVMTENRFDITPTHFSAGTVFTFASERFLSVIWKVNNE